MRVFRFEHFSRKEDLQEYVNNMTDHIRVVSITNYHSGPYNDYTLWYYEEEQ